MAELVEVEREIRNFLRVFLSNLIPNENKVEYMIKMITSIEDTNLVDVSHISR